MWQLLDAADPAGRSTPGRRSVLADVIAELDHAGLVRPAGVRSWDRSQKPHLPRFVSLPASEPPKPAARMVWHHRLAWVEEARPSPAQRTHLESLNTWFHEHDHEDLPVIPHRERSVKIFGNEKVLDKLMGTALFGDGRLSLDILRARRVAPNFIVESLGHGPLLLIVENSDTFDSLVSALRREPGNVGLVGWGAGGAFEQSVLSIGRLTPAVRDVRYFGDLDAKGLQIPANAAAVAARGHLPTVKPAIGLYEAMFRYARPQPGQSRLAATTAHPIAAWLPPYLQNRAAEHLMRGTRLAQEEVGITELIADRRWRSDLE
ncbi:Wadjet anti-phage system protein JetD domain-containing protein [Amycolatopsis marina]|uniref:Wadjet anti-phage system protein JetD domain-containing protein n=1 Tax=Amycolatopsis marina TaxID=490629 RepID=UPI0011600E1E|nr:Wadjet anti-phage system protein JetD domain-containing protein [Amycolatopsis marina]